MDITTNVPNASVRPVRRVGRSISLVLLLAACAACGRSSATEARDNPPTPSQLRWGVALPKNTLNNFVNQFVSDSLVGIAWDGRTIDKVVRDPRWTDQLSLNLRIQPNLTFHDGLPIDREYFRRTLETTLKAKQQAGTNISYRSVTRVDNDPDDPQRIIIRLSRPEAFFLVDLANTTLPHPSDAQIGYGAYRVESSGSEILLRAFDGYYRGRSKIDTLKIQNFSDQRASWAALMRGEVDAVHEIAPNAIDFVQAEGQTTVKTYQFIRPYYYQLLFNVRNPVLKNPAVRQALSYGIDRQAVVDLALNKQGIVAEGPIWPFHWAYSTAQKTYTHNTEAATLRLDSVGLKVRPSKEPGRMPSRLRFSCMILAKDPMFERIALLLQKQLFEIGVDMDIEPVGGLEIGSRLTAGNFDTALVPRTSGRSLAWTYLSFYSTESPGGYTAADKVLDELRRTTSEADIRRAVSDLQQIFHDDPPAIFIAWPKVARVVSAKFNVPDEGGRDVISSFTLWRPVASRQ